MASRLFSLLDKPGDDGPKELIQLLRGFLTELASEGFLLSFNDKHDVQEFCNRLFSTPCVGSVIAPLAVFLCSPTAPQQHAGHWKSLGDTTMDQKDFDAAILNYSTALSQMPSPNGGVLLEALLADRAEARLRKFESLQLNKGPQVNKGPLHTTAHSDLLWLAARDAAEALSLDPSYRGAKWRLKRSADLLAASLVPDPTPSLVAALINEATQCRCCESVGFITLAGKGVAEVEVTSGTGRGVVTKQPIIPPYVLLSEAPLAVVPEWSTESQVCAGCFRQDHRLHHPPAMGPQWEAAGVVVPLALTAPCLTCTKALFCCATCRDQSSHSKACSLLRVMMGDCYAMRNRDTSRSLCLNLLLIEAGMLSPPKGTSLDAVVMGMDNLSMGEFGRSSVNLDNVFDCLVNASWLQLFRFSKSISPAADLCHAMYRFLQVRANSFAVDYTMRTYLAPQRQIAHNLGSALYREASFFNHSCQPNSTRSFTTGGAMEVRIVEEAKYREEVTLSYGPAVSEKGRLLRQRTLWRRFGFLCRCGACEGTGRLADTHKVNEMLWRTRCPNCQSLEPKQSVDELVESVLGSGYANVNNEAHKALLASLMPTVGLYGHTVEPHRVTDENAKQIFSPPIQQGFSEVPHQCLSCHYRLTKAEILAVYEVQASALAWCAARPDPASSESLLRECSDIRRGVERTCGSLCPTIGAVWKYEQMIEMKRCAGGWGPSLRVAALHAGRMSLAFHLLRCPSVFNGLLQTLYRMVARCCDNPADEAKLLDLAHQCKEWYLGGTATDRAKDGTRQKKKLIAFEVVTGRPNTNKKHSDSGDGAKHHTRRMKPCARCPYLFYYMARESSYFLTHE